MKCMYFIFTEKDCVCVLANVIGIMIGIGAKKTNLWHHLFSPMTLNDTFVPGILVCRSSCNMGGVKVNFYF